VTARFEAIMAVKIQVEIIYVVTPCSIMVGYQYFSLKMEAAWTYKMSVSYHNTT
jgi:hypothetical protein